MKALNINLLDKYLKDVLNKLTNIDEKQQKLDESQQKIEISLNRIEKKVDEIHKYIVNLSNNINELKNISRDEEDKIFLINQQLDRFEDFLHSSENVEIKDYNELSKRLFNNWDELDELTKKFIPVAEFLFTQLQLKPEMDFSPVVIEYCRAIENEFLLKVFKTYTIDLIKSKGYAGTHTFLVKDQGSENTKVFAGIIKKSIGSLKPEYTLGQMNIILLFLTQEYKVKNSPLLSDFKLYLNRQFDTTKLLDTNYIKEINRIVKKFRNPAAHPNFIKLNEASECKKSIPSEIDHLIECKVANNN